MHDVKWSKGRNTSNPRTKAQKEGIAFENEVCFLWALELPNNWHLLRGPWIEFTSRERQRLAQPDALLINFRAGLVLILECKLRHTGRAIPQMQKYLKLIKKLFPYPQWRISAIEIYKYHDYIEFPNLLNQNWHSPNTLPQLSHCPWTGKPPRIAL